MYISQILINKAAYKTKSGSTVLLILSV